MKKNHIQSTAQILTMFCVLLIQSNFGFSQSDRERWQPPDKIIDAIGVKPGMVIGEAGAGSGFFTFHLAKRVGGDGKVFANDIDKDGLATIRARTKREGVKNVETVLGKIEDPRFPSKDLDMIIMVYVLHHLDKPIKFLENLKPYLKPDAPLVIIERNTNRERAHPPSFMTKKQILETIQETNFELVKTETFLSRDTIYIYKLRATP